MSNARGNAESIANARRGDELRRMAVKKNSIERDLSMPIGLSGIPRAASATAALKQQAEEIATEIAHVHALKGEELIERYVPELAKLDSPGAR
jgi:hypothetical protein